MIINNKRGITLASSAGILPCPRGKRGTTLTGSTGIILPFPQGRRGGKVISIYWFAILTIIAGGIILMANAFYGSPYDVREVEAEILAHYVADCVYFGGVMHPGLVSPTGSFKQEFADNFLDHCDLNFNFKEEFRGVEYYVGLRFYNDAAKKGARFTLEAGNKNWVSDCDVEGNTKKLAKCYSNEFWASDSSGKAYLVDVLTIVNKVEENVK